MQPQPQAKTAKFNSGVQFLARKWGPQRWALTITSLLLLATLITGGLVAVLLAARFARDKAIDQAGQDGRDALLRISDDFHVAFTTGNLLKQLIRTAPFQANIIKQASIIYPILSLAPPNMLRCAALLPAGRWVLHDPPVSGDLGNTLKSWDSIAPYSSQLAPSLKSDTVASLSSDKVILYSGSSSDSWFSVLFPVYAPATSKQETWGWPADTAGATECASGAIPTCFNATAKLKWWGQVMLVFNRTTTFHDLEALKSNGYAFRVTYSYSQDASLVPGGSVLAASPPAVLATHLDMASCESPTVDETVHIIDDLQLTLSVCIARDFQTRWKTPLLVVVVVVPCVLVLLLAFGVSRWIHHSELLKGLLPEPIIKELARSGRSTLGTDPRIMRGTPADQLISLLTGLLQGKTTPPQDVVQLISALKQQRDLYTPADVLGRLKEAGMDQEAAAALMSALVSLPKKSSEHGGMRTSLNTEAVLMSEHQHDHVSLQEGLLSIINKCGHELEQNNPDHVPATPSPPLPLTSSGDSPTLIMVPSVKSLKSSIMNSRQQLGSQLSFLEVDEDELLVTCTDNPAFASNTICTVGPQPALLEKLEQVLMKSVNLQDGFDAWALRDASRGHPLAALGFWVFMQSGIVKEFNIPAKTLIKFLQEVESGYKANPYHNSTHAADVLQSVHAMLHTGGLRGVYADSFTAMACYLAAVVHDYEHKGVTNDYLINTRDELALRYNDRSPQENHHLSAAFVTLSKPEFNLLSHFPPAEWVRLRKLIIELVLATDMRQNFAIVGQFVTMHRLASTTKRSNSERLRESIVQASATSSTITRIPTLPRAGPSTSVCGSPSGKLVDVVPGNTMSILVAGQQDTSAQADMSSGFVLSESTPSASCPAPLDEAERMLGLQMMLKACDLGHACADLHVHLKWVAALEEEMFQQGDKEKSLGLPVSPLCDRLQGGVTKSQVGFFEVVVMPLLTHFCTHFPSTKAIKVGAANNLRYWQCQARMTGPDNTAKT